VQGFLRKLTFFSREFQTSLSPYSGRPLLLLLPSSFNFQKLIKTSIKNQEKLGKSQSNLLELDQGMNPSPFLLLYESKTLKIPSHGCYPKLEIKEGV